MKITIESKIIEYLDRHIRKSIRFLYGWLSTDGEVLGYVLAVIHIMLGFTLPLLVVISYTVYPVFWLQCAVFLTLLTIWLHHIFLRVCIIIVSEKNLTNNESPYFRMFRDMTGIDGEHMVNYLVVFETGVILALFLGLLEKIIKLSMALGIT
jgi:hypothetical protein